MHTIPPTALQLMPWTERRDVPGDTDHLPVQRIYESPCIDLHEDNTPEDFGPGGHSLPKRLQKIIKKTVTKYSKYNFVSGKEWNQTKYRPCPPNSNRPSPAQKIEASLIKDVVNNLPNSKYEQYVTTDRVRKALKKMLDKTVSNTLHPTPKYYINHKKIEKLIQMSVEKRLKEQSDVKRNTLLSLEKNSRKPVISP